MRLVSISDFVVNNNHYKILFYLMADSSVEYFQVTKNDQPLPPIDLLGITISGEFYYTSFAQAYDALMDHFKFDSLNSSYAQRIRDFIPNDMDTLGYTPSDFDALVNQLTKEKIPLYRINSATVEDSWLNYLNEGNN